MKKPRNRVEIVTYRRYSIWCGFATWGYISIYIQTLRAIVTKEWGKEALVFKNAHMIAKELNLPVWYKGKEHEEEA